ncbi:MAG TPA: hypothetical protein VF515_18025 [Candidatus Binatia bacterium]
MSGKFRAPNTRAHFHLTKSLDGTRLVIANDGWQYFLGDVWGIHSYVADGITLSQHLSAVLAEPTTEVAPGRQAALPGVNVVDVPVMLTECGGLALRDNERSVAGQPIVPLSMVVELHSAVADRLDDGQEIALANENARWTLSNILHGEQVALSLSTSLCEMFIDPGAQEYAPNQAREEAERVGFYRARCDLRYTYARECPPSTYRVVPVM